MATELSVGQFLTLTVDDRVLFIKQNLSNNPDGTLNIQNFTDWENLSEKERHRLAQTLL